MIARSKEIEEEFNTDIGHRYRFEKTNSENIGFIEFLNYLGRNLKKFMTQNKRKVALHMHLGKVRSEYKPLGLVCIIAPWY